MSENRIKVGITFGDTNGIGCEVALKALSDTRMSELFVPVVYGSAKVVGLYKKCSPQTENFQYTVVKTASEAKGKRINLINCLDENLKIEPGTATKESGSAAVDALERAVSDLKQGLIDVLVTGPINKENVQSERFSFPGHTEYLASCFEGSPIMLMCSDLMKMGLVTTHLPLSEVSGSITTGLVVEKLKNLRHSIISDFGIVEPRIAVLALNPHAGDGGLLGTEEQTQIKPAIEEAARNGILAFGPFAADGFFASSAHQAYDAVLAMYHDQGLAPFKALTPEGVNFTAGLSAIRTSPDHGTAFDIAGHGVADETSMREAIYLALDIYRNRQRYQEMTRDPLRHYERDRGADMSVNDLPPEAEESAGDLL